MREWVCVCVHVYIYLVIQAYMSLHLCLGYSVYLFVLLLQFLFLSNPVSHRVNARDDLSEQLWDGKEDMSTEYTMLWRAVIAATCYSGLLEEAQLSASVYCPFGVCSVVQMVHVDKNR